MAAVLTVLGAAAGPVAGVLPASAVRADVPVTSVRIGQLDRGEGPAVPRVVGTAVVEGDRVLDVDADEVQLLGTSGEEYVVATWADGGSAVERVAADGSRSTVLDRVPYAVDLSGDGTRLVTTRTPSLRRTVLAVRDSTTGEVLVRRVFGAGAAVLDVDDGRVLVGQTGPARTLSWTVATDRVTRVAGRAGYAADISADRLAVFTAPVYDGGCTVLARLSAPRRTLWRSCEDAVLDISPDGRRVLTTGVYADGPLGRFHVDTARGRRVASYDSPGGFGVLGWEDARTVLVTASDRRGRSALVRCDAVGCERASGVVAP
ncbi:hypothetical protein ASG94_10200 [Nocardioides sp. Soil805]|nr:hypothetical protein ASG94_10200 [Nocardioides sp. Soil805]